MKILFDHQAFDLQRYGGVSKLYCETIPLMHEQFDFQIGVRESDNVYLHESNLIKNLRDSHHINWGILKSYNFFGKQWITRHYEGVFRNRKYSIKLLKKQQFDIFEPTFFEPYFLEYLGKKPFVLSIHDMTPEKYPQLFSGDTQAEHKKLLCPLAAHIMTPTHQTKNDIVEILNINPEKITVVSRGINSLPETDTQPPIQNPFILYVGTRQLYKNFFHFLKSFVLTAQKYPDLHLICTGPVFNSDEQRFISTLNIGERIHHLSPSVVELSALYRNAVAFVFPSLYEGFGLPILEAFSCGCPVMLNNTGCFSEVASDAAIYFDMFDNRTDFVDKFDFLWNFSADTRNKLINKGYERLKCFSWSKTANKITTVYKSIL